MKQYTCGNWGNCSIADHKRKFFPVDARPACPECGSSEHVRPVSGFGSKWILTVMPIAVMSMTIILLTIYKLSPSLIYIIFATASNPPNSAYARPKFHWLPPQASAKEVIPLELLAKGVLKPTLKDIDAHLTKALRQIEHYEYSYFPVPHGYALVAHVEKIQNDGTPITGRERWEAKLSINDDNSSVKQFFKVLFTSNKGYYRVIVFIFSSKAWSESEDKVSEDEAVMWLRRGYDRLPDELASTPFTPSFICTALIYEFEQTTPKTEAQLISPGKLAAHTHLEASGFYKALGE